MSEKDLIAAIDRKYKEMPEKSERPSSVNSPVDPQRISASSVCIFSSFSTKLYPLPRRVHARDQPAT